MSVIYHNNYIEIVPENNYITDLDETAVFEGICGKNLNVDSYKDITDEEAEEILKRLEQDQKEQ